MGLQAHEYIASNNRPSGPGLIHATGCLIHFAFLRNGWETMLIIMEAVEF